MSKQKIFLNVHYLQRAQVKSLGARWDSSNKKWYIAYSCITIPPIPVRAIPVIPVHAIPQAKEIL